MVFCGHRGVMGTGFTGTGLGWTLPTRARPVCHPSELDMLPSDEREDIFEQMSDVHDAVTKVCPFFYLATNLLVNFLRSIIWHYDSEGRVSYIRDLAWGF